MDRVTDFLIVDRVGGALPNCDEVDVSAAGIELSLEDVAPPL